MDLTFLTSLLPFAFFLLTSVQESPPIIVKIIEPPKDPTEGIADVLIGSLGIAGVLTLLAVFCGVLMAGVLFWMRSRKPYDH